MYVICKDTFGDKELTLGKRYELIKSDQDEDYTYLIKNDVGHYTYYPTYLFNIFNERNLI